MDSKGVLFPEDKSHMLDRPTQPKPALVFHLKYVFLMLPRLT